MGSRYRDIADHLRRRIAAGEWTIGGVLPPLAQLQDEYDGCALNTVRAAQQELVDDGILETISGRGAYVRRLPHLDLSREDARHHLAIARDAVADALQALDRQPTTPPASVDDLDPEDSYDHLTGEWGYMTTAYCRTCDTALRGTTRGWIEVPDELDLYAELGHQDHDVVTLYGASKPSDPEGPALLREQWWERRAHLERAGEELLRGNTAAAHGHAGRAHQILTEHPEVDRLAVHLLPDSPAQEGRPGQQA